jgi:hypothetical protein
MSPGAQATGDPCFGTVCRSPVSVSMPGRVEKFVHHTHSTSSRLGPGLSQVAMTSPSRPTSRIKKRYVTYRGFATNYQTGCVNQREHCPPNSPCGDVGKQFAAVCEFRQSGENRKTTIIVNLGAIAFRITPRAMRIKEMQYLAKQPKQNYRLRLHSHDTSCMFLSTDRQNGINRESKEKF